MKPIHEEPKPRIEYNQPKHTQDEWNQSGEVMLSSDLQVHTERAFCQFIDTKFADTKPALAFGRTKEEAEANVQRIVKAVNLLSHIENIVNTDTAKFYSVNEKYLLRELLKQAEQK